MAWYSTGILELDTTEDEHRRQKGRPNLQSREIDEIAKNIKDSADLFNYKELSFWAGVSLLFFSLLAKWTLAFISLLIIWTPLHMIIRKWDKKRRFINLSYDKKSLPEPYLAVIDSINALTENERIWTLDKTESIFGIHEQKRNSGANSLIEKSACNAGHQSPPWTITNIHVPSLHSKHASLYFIPEGILIFNGVQISPLSYKESSATYSFESIIDENPPKDATITGKTWKHPNKDGTADGRFSENYQIPVCLYGKIIFKLGTTIKIDLITSKKQSGQKFYDAYPKF